MEDDAYLQSTQYRYFIFTPEKLSQLRQQTNAIASQRLHEDLQSALLSGEITPNAASPDPGSGVHINCEKTVVANPATVLEREELTAEEELKLVSYYATACVKLCDHLKAGSGVKATALTFLQRIYLRISPLQMHPKTLLLPICFLALKSENGPQSTSWFIRMAAEIGVKTTKEDLLAPEINIAMNLRWAFHVLHPYRGVEGLKLELYAIALGTYKAPPVAPDVPGPTAAQAQARLFKSVEENGGGKSVGSVIERIESVCGKARLLLTGPALFTDVYFLYTPSQITLAGLWCLDRALAEFLIDIKFSHNQRVREKLLHVVKQCAERHLLVTLDSPNHYPGLLLRLPQNGVPMGVDVTPEIHQEVVRIDKKLFHLKKPLKDAKHKHPANDSSAEEEKRRAKKRKLELEKKEKDDIFGSETIPRKK